MTERSPVGLNGVHVSKVDLLKQVEVNLEKHRKEFKTALVGWRQAVVLALRKAYEMAESGEDYITYLDVDSSPVDHSVDYEEIITMLEASQDNLFLVTREEFRRYWLDNWTWSTSHKMSVDTYSR